MWDDLRDYKILEGDCLELMRSIPSDSIDAIVTDPPYGLGFMGKDWDASVPGVDWARECLRVLKPGGHLVAFGGTRTVHRLTCAIEDGGFEIRDLFNWIYFSGFPKNLDVSKQFDREAGLLGIEGSSYTDKNNPRFIMKPTTDSRVYTPPEPQSELAKRYKGYGTALKPAIEPATLARKPLEKGMSVARNVAKWGTGAINIDACRFAFGDPCWVGPDSRKAGWGGWGGFRHTHGEFPDQDMSRMHHNKGYWPANIYQCSKPCRSERERGLDDLPKKTGAEITGREPDSAGLKNGRSGKTVITPVSNHHPTVKPLKLMRFLCRLLGTEKGATILDPFCGSGTTGAAAILEGYNFIGIEREAQYIPIIKGRLNWAREEYKRENAQLGLFGEVG